MNKANPIIYQDNEKTIFNIFSKYGIFKVTIDTEDINKIKNYKWHVFFQNKRLIGIQGSPGFRQSSVYIHKVITGNDSSDHINGDVFNNRKNNLRECSYLQNNKNVKPHSDSRISYKGVDEPRPGKYRSRIMCDGKCITIGYCNTPEKAALAYNKKALELHKEFARLNIIK